MRSRRRAAAAVLSLVVLCLPLASQLRAMPSTPTDAPPAITTAPSGRQWILSSGEMTYAIGVNEQGMLQTQLWGARLAPTAALTPPHSLAEQASFDPSITTTPLEYPAWGAGLSTEPALKLTSANGDRTLVLEFQSARMLAPDAQPTDRASAPPAPTALEITLRDTTEPIIVRLLYQLYPGGILARSSRIENRGKSPVVLEQVASATWNLPPTPLGYTLTTLTGQWAGEWQLRTAPLHPGTAMIESRRGSTSHQANPWFSVGLAAPAANATSEEAGPVWFGELGWSGSWRFAVEQTAQNAVRVTGGWNPFDFAFTLNPGDSRATPPFYAGYTSHGQGEASRILHRFQLAQILPTHPDPKPRPIIYNSWEATEFAVSEAGQIALAEKAAGLGVERFVMDDGWFGARNLDNAGLGDWTVNPKKFPHGLKPLIDRVHALGMDFGLWVEPEMVNPDSELYRKHPDWVMNFPGRQRTEARSQLVLNLARPDVRDYVFSFLDKLVTENQIAFLKWDYNRNWSEPGWPTAPGQSAEHPNPTLQKEIYVDYVTHLYGILRELREKHPGLEIESCSGGGGRVDLGILRYTDEVWPSDNTDANDRLAIQNGFTYAYTPETMVAWVTDVPNHNSRSTPLEFRYLVAMQGALGVGNNLNKLSEGELAQSKDLVSFYKQIRTTIQHGDLYRLLSPLVGDAANPTAAEASAVQYVNREPQALAPAGKRSGAATATEQQTPPDAVVLAYLRSQHFGLPYPTLPLRGLDPTATYRVHALHPTGYAGAEFVSGSVLMSQGLALHLVGDYAATAVTLTRVSPSLVAQTAQ